MTRRGYSENALKCPLAILLAGRIAERIALLGMGEMTYGKRQQMQFLDNEVSEYRNYTDETARMPDNEILESITEGEQRATEINNNRSVLDALANLLREKEVVQREAFMSLLG